MPFLLLNQARYHQHFAHIIRPVIVVIVCYLPYDCLTILAGCHVKRLRAQNGHDIGQKSEDVRLQGCQPQLKRLRTRPNPGIAGIPGPTSAMRSCRWASFLDVGHSQSVLGVMMYRRPACAKLQRLVAPRNAGTKRRLCGASVSTDVSRTHSSFELPFKRSSASDPLVVGIGTSIEAICHRSIRHEQCGTLNRQLCHAGFL